MIDDDEEEDKVVEKTIPMKPEWKKLREEWMKHRDAYKEAEAKASTLRKAFWSKVEMDSGIYNQEMEVDDENNEIKIFADDKE